MQAQLNMRRRRRANRTADSPTRLTPDVPEVAMALHCEVGVDDAPGQPCGRHPISLWLVDQPASAPHSHADSADQRIRSKSSRTILTTHGTCVRRSAMWRNWEWSSSPRDATQRREGTHGEYRFAMAAEDQAERTVIDRIVELRHSGQSYRSIAATPDAEELSPQRAYGRADRRIARPYARRV